MSETKVSKDDWEVKTGFSVTDTGIMMQVSKDICKMVIPKETFIEAYEKYIVDKDAVCMDSSDQDEEVTELKVAKSILLNGFENSNYNVKLKNTVIMKALRKWVIDIEEID